MYKDALEINDNLHVNSQLKMVSEQYILQNIVCHIIWTYVKW